MFKLFTITFSSVVTALLIFHFSSSMEKKAPVNLSADTNYTKLRKIITVFFSFPIFYIYSLLIIHLTANHLPIVITGILSGISASFLFLLLESFFLKHSNRNGISYPSMVFYTIHAVISFPIFGGISAYTYKKFISKFAHISTNHFIYGIAASVVMYFIFLEIIYFLQNKRHNSSQDYVPVKDFQYEGEYTLETLSGEKKFMNIWKKDTSFHIAITPDNLKIKGNAYNGKINADLSGELPKLELFHTTGHKFTGTYSVKSKGKIKIIPVKAVKNNTM